MPRPLAALILIRDIRSIPALAAVRADGAPRRPPRLRVRHLGARLPGLDPAHDGLRIAHLTDLHVGLMTPDRRIAAAVEAVRAARPDLTVLTGDYVCYSPRMVGRMADLLAGLPGEVTAVLGNHDHWTDGAGVARTLARLGYAVLRNGHRTVRPRGLPLHLIGFDDRVTGRDDVPRALHGVPRSGLRVVLSHLPELADVAALGGADLVLAGHTHGGQVSIPRVTMRLARRLGLRYLWGFYPVGRALLFVNCGVGASALPIRAGAPPEVAILTLRAAGEVGVDHAPARGIPNLRSLP